MSRDLDEGTYYVSHGGKVPIKWTAPEVYNKLLMPSTLYTQFTPASSVVLCKYSEYVCVCV